MKPVQKKISLRYVGPNFIPGIPARDLTEAEVKEFGGENFLLETEQYVKEVLSAERSHQTKGRKK